MSSNVLPFHKAAPPYSQGMCCLTSIYPFLHKTYSQDCTGCMPVRKGVCEMATQKTKEISKEIRESVAKQILELMEQDGLHWAQGFDASMFLAHNPTTPTQYRGINRVWLALMQKELHIKDPRWCTFKQAKDNGWRVKKGSHAQKVECYKPVPCVIEDGNRRFLKENEVKNFDPEEVIWPVCLVSTASVFSYSDLEGVDEYIPSPTSEGFELADALIKSSRCPVFEAAVHAACYRPVSDEIVIPPRGAYDEPTEFTSTLLHEMAHSTMVPLERKTPKVFKLNTYAFEELCAELACVFASAELGLPLDGAHLENHAAYLKAWLGACKEDFDAMTSAINIAQGIADYLLENLPASAKVKVS